MSGSHNAPEPSGQPRNDEGTEYHLLPPAALHPLSDLNRLMLRVDKLEEALGYANKRIDDMTRAAMTDLGSVSHEAGRLREELAGVNRIAVTAETATAGHERRLTALERTVEALLRRLDGRNG